MRQDVEVKQKREDSEENRGGKQAKRRAASANGGMPIDIPPRNSDLGTPFVSDSI